MSTIDITVAETHSNPPKATANPTWATKPAQTVPGFYVGSTFIPDSAPNPRERACEPATAPKKAH
jgi:hypothetical protein